MLFIAIEILVLNAIFLTNPTELPSGVSAGHIIPICELSNLRGCTSLPFFSIAVLIRLKCDNVLA